MARGPSPCGCSSGPISTWIVPGNLAQPFFGQKRPALCAMGSTGRLAFTASAAPPRENLAGSPSGVRVPSGKISTQACCCRRSWPCLAICLRATLGVLRSMAIGLRSASAQPKKGTRSSSRLSTWLSGSK
ncbi:hypothetical protein D3C78_1345870 [compost metagenome]